MKTIQINNKHYQECDVVMLPTDVSNRYNCTEGLIVKCIKSWTPIGENEIKENTLGISKNHNNGVLNYYQPQHLYILSKDEIKEGEYGINGYNEVVKFVSKIKDEVTVIRVSDNCKIIGAFLPKKIIATTDSSLEIYTGEVVKNRYAIKTTIPQIPQSFIEYFISEYNKGNVISKVLVEVEKLFGGNSFVQRGKEPSKKEKLRGCYDNGKQITGKWKELFYYELKLNQNNEISILTEQKQSYSREEVIELLKKLPYNPGKQEIDKWIKQNLK